MRKSRLGLTAKQLNEILCNGLPRAAELQLKVEQANQGTCKLRLPYSEQSLRPGGTISGPTMMGLADAAMWISVMSQLGDVQLAVTTQFNINFLRKPPPTDLLAHGQVLKLGRRLAILEVSIYSEQDETLILAHATGTYSIP